MSSYNTDIFQDYFAKDGNPDYLRVHRGNQESYIDNFIDLLPSNRECKILEIGCGAGQLLYCLKKAGYINIEGVDIGEGQVKFLKDMGVKGSLISSIPEYLLDKISYYDIIIMNQVMEHFSKDELWRNLKAIYNALRGGGLFIFATPNMACSSGLFQRYIDFTHEIGFTERSAYQVMRTLGFNDIMIRGDIIKLRLRPRRIAWWVFNRIWYGLLGFIYYIERGMDRPKILSRHLIVRGRKLIKDGEKI